MIELIKKHPVNAAFAFAPAAGVVLALIAIVAS